MYRLFLHLCLLTACAVVGSGSLAVGHERLPFQACFSASLWDHFLQVRDTTHVSWRTPALVEALGNTKPLDEVFLVTHQTENLERQTASLLGQPEFQNVPRLFLVSENFQLGTSELVDQMTHISYSIGGRLEGIGINASTVHLAGGYCSLCLGTTVSDVIRKSLKQTPQRSSIKVVAHTNLIYTSETTQTLRSEISQWQSSGGLTHVRDNLAITLRNWNFASGLKLKDVAVDVTQKPIVGVMTFMDGRTVTVEFR